MCSRMWRRASVPPVPALIPIGAVRGPNGCTERARSTETSSRCSSVDWEGSVCGNPCVETQCNLNAVGEDDSDREVEVEVHEGRQRARRRPKGLRADAEPIDAAAASRDDVGPQAPARRPKPQRHRKSDRRRHHHRSQRLLRKREHRHATDSACTPNNNNINPSSTNSSRCTSIRCGGSTEVQRLVHSQNNISASSVRETNSVVHERPSRHHHHHSHHHHGEVFSNNNNNRASSTPAPTPNPRVNPIFVWVRQEDTRIVDVRCEDYDKRNRILLTKTAHGWRAIPRTETLTTSLEEAPATADTTTTHKPPRKPRGRKSSKTKRYRPNNSHERDNNKPEIDQDHAEDDAGSGTSKLQEEEPVRNESPFRPLSPETPPSPSWNTPVNVESHLPSHTIPVPRRQSTDANSSIASASVVVGDVNGTVNSREAHAHDLCVPPEVSSPLDNLLAVAELEFKQHQVQEEQAQFNLDAHSRPNTPPSPHSPHHSNNTSPHHSHTSQMHHKTLEDHFHTDELEQEQEVDNQHENDIEMDHLNTLANVSTEEAAKSDELSLTAENHTDLCDYNDDDENMAMNEILSRLEQSLQSPMEEETPEPEIVHGKKPEEMPENEQCELKTVKIKEEEEDPVVVIEIEDDDIPEEQETEHGMQCKEEEKRETLDTNEQDIKTENTKIDDSIDQHEEETQQIQDDVLEHEQDQEENKSILREDDPDITIISDSSEGPTDLSYKPMKKSSKSKIKTEESEDELPTDLTITSKTQSVPEDAPEDDMQPTDLSIRKHCNPSPGLRIEAPRPPSQNSETIQSPQPSGIPAVPPSPDIYAIKPNSKSLFLESLLSSASPKLALTPEVTITRNQKEPLDLGKSRKSASPTVSCSEEAKNKFSEGEPATKRVKIEDLTLKNLLHADKKKPEVTSDAAESINKVTITLEKNVHHNETAATANNSTASNSTTVESSRLLELLTSDNDPDPVSQLKQLYSDNEMLIPDPLLVPKDRLSLILSSPAKEIPRLLAQRPELRLPEALAYPQLLQDPDILVITLAQLQTILQKQNQPIIIQEKPNNVSNNKESSSSNKKTETSSPKPTVQVAKQTKLLLETNNNHHQSNRSSSSTSSSHSSESNNNNTEYQHRLQNPASNHQQILEAQLKQQKEAMANIRPNGLAGEIDAATTAAFNQMLWLPYLNHLEAAAMACGNNNEFLKALNTVFPNAGGPTSNPTPYSDSLSMFGAAAGRFGGLHSAGFPPMQPPVDYTNPLELAMWQEAMLQANLQQRNNKLALEGATTNMKNTSSSYREEQQRNLMNQQKKYSSSGSNSSAPHHQQVNRVHSSARTSPISHTFHQQRMAAANPFVHSITNGYPIPNLRHNLQIPQYNPSSISQQQALLQHHQQQQQQAATAALSAAAKRSSMSNYRSSNHSNNKSEAALKQFQANAYSKYEQYMRQQAQQAQQHLQQSKSQHKNASDQLHQQHHSNQNSQKTPRVTCKSLQNLLSPTRGGAEDTAMPPKQKNQQPIDLSGAKPPHIFSKLKVKQNLMDPVVAFGAKLWRHEDVPEVGSTTEEMSTQHLHETQTHLWHPLFGK